jgi:hypothetical protein
MSKISDGDALAADPHSTTKDSPAAHQVYIYVVCVVYVCVCVCLCYIRLAQIHIKTQPAALCMRALATMCVLVLLLSSYCDMYPAHVSACLYVSS